MAEKVYRWSWNCGRMGDLNCLFVADEQEIADAVGKHAYFGEVLGKHSEVQGTLEAKEFEVLSDHLAVVEFVKEHGPFGRNPLRYVTVECDECGTHMNVEEEQDFWCHDCEMRLCYPCAEGGEHNECRPVVEYDKRAEPPCDD